MKKNFIIATLVIFSFFPIICSGGEITAAYWSDSYVLSGTGVTLTADTVALDGEQAQFDIYEDDLLGDDYITTIYGTVYSGRAQVNWITIWVDDASGGPEYFFKVKIAGEEAQSGQLEVGDGSPPEISGLGNDTGDGFIKIRTPVAITAGSIQEFESELDWAKVFYRWPDGIAFKEVELESSSPPNNYQATIPVSEPTAGKEYYYTHPGVLEYYVKAANTYGATYTSQTQYINVDLVSDPREEIIRPSIGLPIIQKRGESFHITIASNLAMDSSDWEVRIRTKYDDSPFILPIQNKTCTNDYWWDLQVGIPSRIREDLYDLTVEVNLRESTRKKAVNVIEEFSQNPVFYQITDIHIGYAGYPPNYDYSDNSGIFSREIEEINLLNPDFVVITGDLTDWGTPGHWNLVYSLLQSFEVPVYTVIGNHDYYDNQPPCVVSHPENLYPYFEKINSFNNYVFDYGPITVACLDSGYDDNGYTLKVQGSGLSDWQMDWLENALNGKTNNFICIHHAVVNEGGGEKNLISTNRPEFMNFCRDNDVIAVLSGHTHKDEHSIVDGVDYYQTRSGTFSALQNNWPLPNNPYTFPGYRAVRTSGN